MGAMKAGGRWNRPRLAPVLYCSLNPGTAAEESMRLFEAAGFARKTVKPRLIVGIRYDLSAVIDLQKFSLSGKAINLPQLLSEDWQRINNEGLESVGQAIGRAAFNAGIEGLLVPSSRVPDALNLVVFARNLRKTSLQEVLEAAELKKWLKP
jgi:RES domain-containing protein